MEMNKKVNKNSRKRDHREAMQWRRGMGKDCRCSTWWRGGSLVAGVGGVLCVGRGGWSGEMSERLEMIKMTSFWCCKKKKIIIVEPSSSPGLIPVQSSSDPIHRTWLEPWPTDSRTNWSDPVFKTMLIGFKSRNFILS